MTTPQRLTVDQQACASTGFCVRVAPELFALSEETDKAMVKSQVSNAALATQAEEAEITCPTGAISFLPSDAPQEETSDRNGPGRQSSANA